jgi:hypothetical protein
MLFKTTEGTHIRCTHACSGPLHANNCGSTSIPLGWVFPSLSTMAMCDVITDRHATLRSNAGTGPTWYPIIGSTIEIVQNQETLPDFFLQCVLPCMHSHVLDTQRCGVRGIFRTVLLLLCTVRMMHVWCMTALAPSCCVCIVICSASSIPCAGHAFSVHAAVGSSCACGRGSTPSSL